MMMREDVKLAAQHLEALDNAIALHEKILSMTELGNSPSLFFSGHAAVSLRDMQRDCGVESGKIVAAIRAVFVTTLLDQMQHSRQILRDLNVSEQT